MKIPPKIKFAQIYSNFPLLASFLFLILAIDQASALNCYICAEGGLEEFGECKTSFPFNCDGYAKRFSAQDKIFCRTTRHKTFNGSYTVVKECIAESAHFATFPRKSAQLEEECDVLELNGFEVAYCLCRDGDLCNGPSIVEQFTEFENKYPELFDPVPASNEAAPSGQNDDIDNGNEEEKGDQKWPPSRAVSNPSNAKNLADTSSSLIRRRMQQQQENEEGNVEEEMEIPSWTNSLPNSLAPPTLPPNQFMAPPQSTERGEQISRPTGPTSPFGTTDESEQRPLEEGDENLEPTSPTIPTVLVKENGQSGREGAGGQFSATNNAGSSAGTGTQLGLLPELQCLQCSESNLAGSDSDCRTQIVLSCPDRSKQSAGIGRPLCLTRQIQNGPNYSIEKACTTERAILDEFGGKEAADLLNGAIRDESACLELPKLGGPTAIKSAAERLCICSTGQCNRAPIAEQIAYGRMLISQPGPEIHFGGPPPSNGLSPSTQRSILPSGPNVPSASNENGVAPLNCAICLDVNLRDPKGDCSNARAHNCAHLLKDEKAYCLTRQTQNGKDSFIVQKSCVSQHQFYQQFPEELEKHSAKELKMGCASTYDGFVNYCICEGQMCNRNGIAQQAEAATTTKNPNKFSLATTTNFNTTEGIGREGGKELVFRNLATPTNPFGIEASKTIAAKNAGAGGSWEQNEAENDALFGTAKVTAKRPAPANFSPSSLWTTQTPPTTSNKMPMPSSTPTTSSSISTTQSTAIRERLEKWKANSQTTTTPSGDSGKMLMKEMNNKNGENGHRRKDIFEKYAEAEGNSAEKSATAQIGHMAILGGLAIWMVLASRIHG